MDDYTTEELVEELARRYTSLIVAGFDDDVNSQIILFGTAGDLCILNANIGHAIISEADGIESKEGLN